jgi:hypothetical protein
MNRKDFALALLLACFALAVRVPFLARSDAFFDSDEAVEGLMARHVLQGEFPTFYWGQSYKGVPEVYISAAVLAIAGSKAAALKSVTAGLFALYIGLNFVLLRRWFGRGPALAGSLLATIGPPSLLYWTLSANAEFVLVMLLGTVLLLLAPALGRSRGLQTSFGLVAGLGAWIHPLIVYYVLPLGLLGLTGSGWWRDSRHPGLLRAVALGRMNGRPRPVVLLLNVAALFYALCGVFAFVTGGVDLSLSGWHVTMHHPQKLWAVAVLLMLASVAIVAEAELRILRVLWRSGWPVLAGFLVGYLPVIVHALRGGRVGAPLRSMDAVGLWRAVPVIAGRIPRILSGFATPFDRALPLGIWLGLPAGVCLALYVWNSRRYLRDVVTLKVREWPLAEGFFPVFMVLLAIVFVVSGMCLDAYSYRYLVPAYAAVPIALALGCRLTGRRARWLARGLYVAMFAVFACQQVLWFQTLDSGSCDRAIAACLRSAGVRGGRADYWISYRMTFLAEEDPVIAPENGVDRYPPYSRFVAGLPRVADVRRVTGLADAPGSGQCRCGDLEAVVGGPVERVRD